MAEPSTVRFGMDILDRMVEAVRRVRLRLEGATATLQAANLPHAVIGANAIRFWVEQAAPGAGRNTPNVDLLLRRADLPAAKEALTHLQFTWEMVPPKVLPPREAKRGADVLHFVVATENIHPTDPFPAPDVTEVEFTGKFHVLRLEPLVRMKVLANRRIDQVHLLDLIGAGAIDSSWLDRLPPEMALRLRTLLDNPNS